VESPHVCPLLPLFACRNRLGERGEFLGGEFDDAAGLDIGRPRDRRELQLVLVPVAEPRRRIEDFGLAESGGRLGDDDLRGSRPRFRPWFKFEIVLVPVTEPRGDI